MKKDCDCAMEVEKVINKPTYTLKSFIRLFAATLLLLTIYNAFAYYCLPTKYYIPTLITLTNTFIGMF